MIFKTVILFLYGSISKANPIINIYEFEYEAVITSNSSFEFYMGEKKIFFIANCNSKLASADKAHRRKGSWEFQVDQD